MTLKCSFPLQLDDEPFNPDFVEVDRVLDQSTCLDQVTGDVCIVFLSQDSLRQCFVTLQCYPAVPKFFMKILCKLARSDNKQIVIFVYLS